MEIEFVLYDDCSLHFNEDHPIFQTPLVKNVVECGHHDGENNYDGEDDDRVVQIPLLQFKEKHFKAFVEFLEDNTAHNNLVGFGKNNGMTYLQALSNFMSHSLPTMTRSSSRNPRRGAKFMQWVNRFESIGRTFHDKTILPYVISIAKYLQVDICNACGILGNGGRDDDGDASEWQPSYTERGVELHHCRQVEGSAFSSKDLVLKALSNSTICISDCGVAYCMDCITKKVGCTTCRQWACTSCQNTPTCRNLYPRITIEKLRVPKVLYQQKGFNSIKLKKCLGCCNGICESCSHQCHECHGYACDRCHEDISTFCQDCKNNMLGNNVHSDEFICRGCFDSNPHYCKCGRRSAAPEGDVDPEWHDGNDRDDEVSVEDEELVSSDTDRTTSRRSGRRLRRRN